MRSRGDPKGQSGDTLKLAPDYADTGTLLRDTKAIGQNRDPSGLLLLLLLQIMRAGSGDWRGEVGRVRGKKIDMQPGGYIRYGTTILTVYSTVQAGTLVVARYTIPARPDPGV